MTTFMVNGKEKKLEMRNENGIDISGDFIGNTAHGMKSDSEGRYIASPEDFAWWENMIRAWQKMEEKIEQYKKKYGKDEVDSLLQESGAWDVDLEDTPGSVSFALKELDKSQNPATLRKGNPDSSDLVHMFQQHGFDAKATGQYSVLVTLTNRELPVTTQEVQDVLDQEGFNPQPGAGFSYQRVGRGVAVTMEAVKGMGGEMRKAAAYSPELNKLDDGLNMMQEAIESLRKYQADDPDLRNGLNEIAPALARINKVVERLFDHAYSKAQRTGNLEKEGGEKMGKGLYPPVSVKMNRMGHITIKNKNGKDVYFQRDTDVEALLDSLTADERDDVENGYEIETTNVSDEYFGE